MPDVYIEELGKLVDEIAPVPFEEIEHVIREDLPADVFVRIDREPLATASIAQVHTALLSSGRNVIVKVRRPGIEKQIEADLALLRSTAELLEKRSERAQLVQACALADELDDHLRAELDFVEEANHRDRGADPRGLRRPSSSRNVCSPPTAASRWSILAYSAGSTMTRAAISHCSCSRSPKPLGRLPRGRDALDGQPIGGAVIVAPLLVSSPLLARVHDLRWYAFVGFCLAFVLGST